MITNATEKYPSVLIKSIYGNYITIVLDEYFQEDNIVESIIKMDDKLKTIVTFNENVKNSKLDIFFTELKVKESVILNYSNQNIEISLLN